MYLTDKVARLTERCQVGDTDAFEALIQATKWTLVRKGRLPRDNVAISAADILQDVYWQFWQARLSVFPPAALAWLVKAARCRRIDQLRAETARKRRAQIVPLHPIVAASEGSALRLGNESLIDHKASVEHLVLANERSGLLAHAVRRLPASYRQVVEGQLRDETLLTTSRRCNVPLGTVKSRRSYAFGRLRKMLEPIREAL